jgi:hypothetical protein
MKWKFVKNNLPKNKNFRGTHGQTTRWSHKPRNPKNIKEDTHIDGQTAKWSHKPRNPKKLSGIHRQQSDIISLLLFFQSEGNKIKIVYLCDFKDPGKRVALNRIALNLISSKSVHYTMLLIGKGEHCKTDSTISWLLPPSSHIRIYLFTYVKAE